MMFEIYPIKNGEVEKRSGYLMTVKAENEKEAIKKAKKHINNPRYFSSGQRKYLQELKAEKI